VRGDVQFGQQRGQLALVVVRREPGAVLHGAEAEEPQPADEPGAGEPAVLGDRVPQHGPGGLGAWPLAECEDPPVALGEHGGGALREHVVDVPAVAGAGEQLPADEPVERDPRGALGEAELGEQADQPAGPDGTPLARDVVGAEQREHQVLRGGLEAAQQVRHGPEHS
jgi:hypothetical protein